MQKRRFDLSVGVSYGDDLEKVRKITLNAVSDIEELSKENKIEVFFMKFGDSSINLSVRMWVNSPEQSVYNNVRSEAILKIKKAYDANDIMIPFPIMTPDFGIKGGTTLKEMSIKIEKE